MKSRFPPTIAPPAAFGIIMVRMLRQMRGLSTATVLFVLLAKWENFGFDLSVSTTVLSWPSPGFNRSVVTRWVGSFKGLELSASEAPLPSRNDNAVSFSGSRSFTWAAVSTAAQYKVISKMSRIMKVVMAMIGMLRVKGSMRALAS